MNFTIFLYNWKMERFWTLKITVRKIQISDFFLFFDNIHKVQNISYPLIPYDDFTSDSAFEKWDSVLYHAEIFRKEKWKQSFLLIDFPQFSQKCTKNERFSHLRQQRIRFPLLLPVKFFVQKFRFWDFQCPIACIFTIFGCEIISDWISLF